jgi:hypothetical protein
LTKYAKRHPELDFSTYVIPQVPGSIHRSHPINGVVESLVKSKKYVVPLFVLSPQVTAGMIVAYLADGRFKAPKDSPRELLPGELQGMGTTPIAATPAAAVGPPAPDATPQLHRHDTAVPAATVPAAAQPAVVPVAAPAVPDSGTAQ